MYVYPIKIKRKKKDAMDVGSINIKNAEDHLNEESEDEWTPF